jgi:4-amino-4-deoxy-L-arabinose transferase-like glycosyltransferase
VWTVGVTLSFVAMAAANMGNFRPVSSDEGEIMAVSYKLGTRGVLGSDPQAGFFHAEDHHFLTLPVQHVLEALSFQVFGAGVAQARGVALAAAVSLIWVVGWLGWRWYGLRAAILGELLLVGWASNLVPGFPGLPLLTVARNGRYDVTAVAFVWLSVALLEATLRRPTRLGAVATGLSAGLAALSQFFGAFALPLVALGWLGQADRRAWSRPTAYWILAGAGLPLLAYAMYALQSFADLVGQWSVYADRGVFGGPAF